MIAVKKPTGRAMSIPAGLAVGAAISGLITLLGCLILTWMVLKGSMVFEFIGYGIMILLLLGVLLLAFAGLRTWNFFQYKKSPANASNFYFIMLITFQLENHLLSSNRVKSEP